MTTASRDVREPSPDGDRTDDDFCWDGLEDPDRFLPPDPLDPDDPARIDELLAGDLLRYLNSLPDGTDSEPAEPTVEEFAAEILDSGPDAAAAVLASLDPGPRSAALLAMVQPASLSPASMVSVIAATEKLASWVQARQHRWLAAFACPGVAAPNRGLREYASQPGQPLDPSRQSSGRAPHRNGGIRSESDAELPCSGSTVHGDPDIDTVLNEAAMKVAAAEIGAALQFSPISAQRRVCQAVDFAVDLPATLRALEKGSIDRGRSLTIADRTQNLPGQLRRRVEDAVLPKATARTPGQLRGIVDRAVISVDPLAAKKRHEKALADRSVTHRAGEDGMGIFRAELPADKARLAYGVIDQIAYQLNRAPTDGPDARGVGALRADVFSDLFDQLASTGTVTIHTTLNRRAVPGDRPDLDSAAPQPAGPSAHHHPDHAGQPAPTEQPDPADQPAGAPDVAIPGVEGAAAGERAAEQVGPGAHGSGPVGTGLGTSHRRTTHLTVTVAASTLAGRDDRPGDLDGHGPIPADLARAIAASASTINAIAIDPVCGSPLDLGRTTYRPRLAQRDHVTTRDQTCRFPGCRQLARRCQLDHSDEFCPGRTDGGVTCPCNLACLCAFHHGLRTGGLWDSVQQPDASITWTSPTGRTYTTYPRRWPTDDDDRVLEPDPDGSAGRTVPSHTTTRPGTERAWAADPGNIEAADPADDPPPF